MGVAPGTSKQFKIVHIYIVDSPKKCVSSLVHALTVFNAFVCIFEIFKATLMKFVPGTAVIFQTVLKVAYIPFILMASQVKNVFAIW